MKKAAIEKARTRLEKAQRSLRSIESCTNFGEFYPAWSDYLIATNSIWFILAAGTKGDQRSQTWYGSKSALRKEDSLLRYLQQARNADEHGLEQVAVHRSGQVAIGKRGETVHITNLRTDEFGVPSAIVHPVDGRYPTVKVVGPHAELVPITDGRSGRTYDPPTVHLGIKIGDNSPLAVGRVGLKYHELLVDEAASLVT